MNSYYAPDSTGQESLEGEDTASGIGGPVQNFHVTTASSDRGEH